MSECVMHVNMYIKNMYISQTQGYFLFYGHGTEPWTKATQCSDFGRGCVLLFAGYIEQKNFMLQIWVKKL